MLVRFVVNILGTKISEDEYFEWKINWPATSSSVDEKGNDKKNNSYKWRKQKA